MRYGKQAKTTTHPLITASGIRRMMEKLKMTTFEICFPLQKLVGLNRRWLLLIVDIVR